MKVLICDDQALPRQLFSMILGRSGRYEVAGEAGSAREAVEFCREHPVDLVLMDALLGSGEDGLAAAWQIRKACPQTRILMVTSMPESRYLKKARELELDGFWYKETGDEPLLEVMDRVMKGEKVFPENPPVVEIGQARNCDFSERELEVLRLMTCGLTDPEIAEVMNISYETVRTYVKRMMKKTGLSRIRLAIEARIHGIAIGQDRRS